MTPSRPRSRERGPGAACVREQMPPKSQLPRQIVNRSVVPWASRVDATTGPQGWELVKNVGGCDFMTAPAEAEGRAGTASIVRIKLEWPAAQGLRILIVLTAALTG